MHSGSSESRLNERNLKSTPERERDREAQTHDAVTFVMRRSRCKSQVATANKCVAIQHFAPRVLPAVLKTKFSLSL